MRKLYRRLVNAITMWLLNHMVFDFSYVTCLAQLKYLWENCPEDHLIVFVRQVGIPVFPFNPATEIHDIISNPGINEESGTHTPFASMTMYSRNKFGTESPHSGVQTWVMNPASLAANFAENGINLLLVATVHQWFETLTSHDCRQSIVASKYISYEDAEALVEDNA